MKENLNLRIYVQNRNNDKSQAVITKRMTLMK